MRKTGRLLANLILFTLPQLSYGASPGGTSVFHYSCEAHAFKDIADPPEAGFHSLVMSGHWATFEILRSSAFASLIVDVIFTYEDSQYVRKTASRSIPMFDSQGMFRMLGPGFREEHHWQRFPRRLGDPAFFFAFRDDERLSKQDFLEWIKLPPEFKTGLLPQAFPMTAKLVQEKAEDTLGKVFPVWAKYYQADCVSSSISEEEYNARRNLSFAQAFGLKLSPAPAPDERPPTISPLELRGLPVYSETGRPLSEGALLRGTSAPLAVLGVQLLRYALAVFSRSPAFAAFFLPQVGPRGLVVNLSRANISEAQARAFFAASSEAQSSLCLKDPAYKIFCASLREGNPSLSDFL